MADQISIQLAESIVAEGSAVTATVNFRTRSTSAASTPSSIRYRVDCRTTKRNVIEWTSVAAASSASIAVPGTHNGIIDTANEYEERQITVEIDPGLSTQARSAGRWRVRNIPNYPAVHEFEDALLLEPHYPADTLESSLTIEHYTYPPAHRFRYLSTFDVLDAHYYRRTDAEISAGVTPVSFQYDAGLFERYGATGDNATNDYTAINNALLQAGQAGGSPARAGQRNVVYFIGANTLTIPNDATLDISGVGIRTTDEASVRFGEGSVLIGHNTTITSSGASGTAVAKTTTATVGEWFIYGFPQIIPTTPGVAGSVGINFTGAYRGRFQVHCGDFETNGIAGGGDATDASRCYYNTIEFRSNNQDGGTTGLLLREGCNGTVLLNPEINGSDELTYYIDCDGVSGLVIDGGYLEGSNDIAATRGIRLTDVSNVLVNGTTLEIGTSVANNFALEVAGASVSGLTFLSVGFGGGWANSAKLGTASGGGTFNFIGGAPTNPVAWVGASSFPTGGTAGELRAGRAFVTGKIAAAVSAAADTAYVFDNTGDGIGAEFDNNSATVTANRAVLVANRKGGPGCVLAAQNNGAAAGGLWFGSGSPESVVAASVGSIYMRTDGGAATSMYVKESGAGTTGWVAK